MVLLTRISIHSPTWQLYIFTGVLGMGLGLVMQVLVLAVQNSVSADQYGVATSGVTLFRSIGGAIGVALFGAVFTHVLQSGLMQQLQKVQLILHRCEDVDSLHQDSLSLISELVQ